jgi:acyl-CoA synthetase (AMP-forming)/AMP-acid ligase II
MIVAGDENVYSGEVEAVIFAHPAVREVAVFRIPDPHRASWSSPKRTCQKTDLAKC